MHITDISMIYFNLKNINEIGMDEWQWNEECIVRKESKCSVGAYEKIVKKLKNIFWLNLKNEH